MSLLIAIALIQAAPFDVKGDYAAMAKEHCQNEWPDDYAMQSHCLTQQVAGMQAFKAVHDELGTKMEKTLENCVKEWTKSRLPDWMMIGHCAKQQAEAYRRLNL